MCSQQDLLYYEDCHYKGVFQSSGSPCRLGWMRVLLSPFICSDGAFRLCGGSADFAELSGVSCQLLEVLQGEWAYSEAVLLLSTWHCC